MDLVNFKTTTTDRVRRYFSTHRSLRREIVEQSSFAHYLYDELATTRAVLCESRAENAALNDFMSATGIDDIPLKRFAD